MTAFVSSLESKRLNRREWMDAMRIAAAGAAVVPLVTTTTGCATLLDLLGGVVKKPNMAIKSMKLQDMSLTTIKSRFITSVANPNPIGFRLNGFEWILGLAGSKLTSGTAPKGVELKAKGSSETEFDVGFDIAKTAEAVMNLIGKKQIPYTIDAIAGLRASKYNFNIPISFGGNMPMPLLPAFDIPSFKMVSAGLSGVKFRVDTAITNLMDFAVPIDALNFDVKMGGNSVIQNKTVKGLELQPKKKEVVPLEFNVDLASLGLNLAKLASNPRFDWEVGAEMASGFLKLPFNQKGAVRL
jgi:LEA14-like dessication related protein